MFFKRLVSQGFKSFANRTEIHLNPGITIVVGPNGCGKSNIFDSILWALGEQRAKALRGHRMGDVIFSGSSAQKAANLSEVTLELNNQAGHLPIDATEVEITRRLYRSGESEYLINGQTSRLKEIQRLMMGTGIGHNSYAVMQQGRIDEIINARPEARRLLIEEAAGISKYKAQKEESLRRLSRTDEDLHRITDLINEVKRNAGKLKKQAERAREYEKLSARLRIHDMVIIARRFNDLMEERFEADQEFNELETRLSGLDVRIEELQEQSDQSRDEMEEVLALLDAANQAQQELTRDKDASTARVNVLQERLSHIEQRRERLGIEIETLSGQNSGQSAEIDDQKKEIQELTTALRENNLMLERKTSALQGLREGASEQDQELANIREMMATLEGDRNAMEGEIRFARQMIDTLSNKLGTGDDQIKALQKEFDDANAESEKTRQAAFAIREAYEEITGKLSEKKEMLGKAEDRQRILSKKHEEVMNALRDARSRLGALQQLQENYDGFVRGVKEIMHASDGGKLNGVLGVVANLFKPHEKCERAIEVALGGAVQNIVVETGQDGKKCIDFLKRKNLGRATFLPLDMIKGRQNSKDLKQLTKMPGVVGWATELVDYDPHIREAANYLLGNTLVVEHLDVALLLEKKGIRIKFVTLDGDLINPSGAMSGGSYRASGLLSRESEITGLVEATEVLARQLVELDADLDRLESSVANYRKLIAELNEKSTELQISLANSVKDAETHEKAAQERKERFENFKEEFDNAQDEKTAYEDQVKLNQANIKDIDKQIEEHKKRTAEFSNAMSSRTEAINKLGDEIQELKIQLAQQEERKTAATRSIERLESETGRQGEMLEQREKELKALEKEEKEARSEIEELEKRTKELTERHAKLEAELKAQSSDKQEKVAALQKLQEDQQAAQRERNILANDLHDADVKRTQKSAQMESLNMQAEEKFASSLDDLMASLESELTDLAENREETAEDDSDPQNEAEVISLEFDHDDPTAFVGTEGDATSGEATDAVDSDIEQTDEERAKWLDHPLAQLPLDTLQAEAQDLRDSIAALGPVNMQAIDDYERIEERLDFMSGQQKDLIAARDTILKTIQKIDETTTTMFRECYDAVRENFINNFRRLFGGGKADLILTNPDDLLTTGIEIIAQPPGKKPQTITLLSGGEKCLTAIGVMFALFQWKPSPICVLDEIDAPLDDANVERFKAMIKEFAASTQFIIISHNKLTMELADTIFGITMQDPGVSNVVSVQFDDIEASGLLEPNATQGGDDVQAKAG